MEARFKVKVTDWSRCDRVVMETLIDDSQRRAEMVYWFYYEELYNAARYKVELIDMYTDEVIKKG